MWAEIKTLLKHRLPKLKFFRSTTHPLLFKVNVFNILHGLDI